jgi:O-acetyl-ADP-ribose deacetylase (regulator of RNase III)
VIHYTRGNLLDAKTEAVVNTVNTVGVMGKGIALAFRDAFPANTAAYEAACKTGELQIGQMFVTENRGLLGGPAFIVNFPTKKHWRHPSKLVWVQEGLRDLRRVIEEHGIRSIAIPPLGCGNGGLEWADVRPEIERELGDLADVEVVVYEPTTQYQTAPKTSGHEKLTPARALIAELVRLYGVLGIECTLLEVQKLAYFIECSIRDLGLPDPLKLKFEAGRYGPYSEPLRHLLDGLDGGFLHCERRLADARPMDVVWFDADRTEELQAYLATEEVRPYLVALERARALIRGFESPLGMELLATLDWLVRERHIRPEVGDVRAALRSWPGGEQAGERKLALFDEQLLSMGLTRLAQARQAA